MDKELDEDAKRRSINFLVLSNGAKVEDLCLTFTIPGTNYEIESNGAEKIVNLDNLDEFIEKLL